MPDHVTRLPWTDEQWAMMQRIVQESARKARVASSFLPLVGPLPDGQASVPALRVVYQAIDRSERGEAEQRLEIDDGKTLPLTRIACNVYLKTQQAEDPDLASAKQMLSRAADVIGRLEDAIVFNGQPGEDKPPANTGDIPKVYTVRGGGKHAGLLGEESDEGDERPEGKKTDERAECKLTMDLAKGGDDVVRAVIAAIQGLERRGHYGPFLDGGPLRRSSVVSDRQGVVVALAGSPIDLVVASDVQVSYVQLTLEPRYVLRVSERFVLRTKQPDARCRLTAVQPEQRSES
jgi:uncharacterized linocin/CFP29 family protein